MFRRFQITLINHFAPLNHLASEALTSCDVKTVLASGVEIDCLATIEANPMSKSKTFHSNGVESLEDQCACSL